MLTNELLTGTQHTIPCESIVTSTIEAANAVSAHCIPITVMGSSQAFIGIWKVGTFESIEVGAMTGMWC